VITENGATSGAPVTAFVLGGGGPGGAGEVGMLRALVALSRRPVRFCASGPDPESRPADVTRVRSPKNAHAAGRKETPLISEPTRLDIRVEHDDASAATVITTTGELDLASADTLRLALLKHVELGVVVLDMRGLDFCDSAGLRTLVEADRAARAQGFALRLAALSPSVDRVLELSGARAVLSTFPDLAAALKA
jgi:anti-anti-sigma factor